MAPSLHLPARPARSTCRCASATARSPSPRATTSTEATVALTPREPGSDLARADRRRDARADAGCHRAAPGRPRRSARSAGGATATRVDVEIVVPTGTALKVSTATADITVQRPQSAAPTSPPGRPTIDGRHRRRRPAAALRQRDQHRCRPVTGSATVRSGSGDAQFGEVGGALQAGFGSGDLEVEHRPRRGPLPRRVRARPLGAATATSTVAPRVRATVQRRAARRRRRPGSTSPPAPAGCSRNCRSTTTARGRTKSDHHPGAHRQRRRAPVPRGLTRSLMLLARALWLGTAGPRH